ncbi:MgtC/SapB family protein [Deefgea sp. CFH1-16]|uniref:MgtC/SapB family protein n=1 Tax=Deefgea sp. CFH1-16 TaxID=2675457 RepID=UPI0019402CFF|nr:MgtC/SapB family protein [Deefgea sp. CFH1-16]
MLAQPNKKALLVACSGCDRCHDCSNIGENKMLSLADQSTLFGLCVALGIGLLVGAERERRKGSGPKRVAAGIRTFVVCALLGAVSVILGDGLLLAVTTLIVGVGVCLLPTNAFRIRILA